MADPAFARATTDVLLAQAMILVDGLRTDGSGRPSAARPSS